MKMCAAIAALGHEVTLVAQQSPGKAESDVADVFGFYGVPPSFEIVPVARPRMRGSAWVYGWRAARLARHRRPDAVLGRNLQACAFATEFGLPTLWDAHMGHFLDVGRDRWTFRRMLGRRSFRRVTTNCDALRVAIEAAVPEARGRVTAAHNGADDVPVEAIPVDLGRPKGRLQVGYVGQLYPGKGLELVTDVARRAPWADFHVVGGEAASVDALRSRLAEPNLILHGFVPPADSVRYRLAFDVLLAPYQREVQVAGGSDAARWMSPLKLFEYMAAGKAILCSDLPILREVMTDGSNGLLAAPDDPDAWLAALVRLRDDVALRRKLGDTALRDFRACHTWKRRAETLLALLAPSAACA
jgi:glycosyltransferase involved in cell wall biosynthesis